MRCRPCTRQQNIRNSFIVDSPHLATTLDRAMGLGRAELVAMGEAGRAWMRRDFSRASVANEMALVYRWGRRPS